MLNDIDVKHGVLIYVLEFIVYISIVVGCMLSLMATIKGSLANKVRNQLQWTQRRQKRLIKVRRLLFTIIY